MCLHVSYLLNKILKKIKQGSLQLYQPCSNAKMHEYLENSTVQEIYKNKSDDIILIIILVIVLWSIFMDGFLWSLDCVILYILSNLNYSIIPLR